jgi:hypothetical protein
MDTLPATIEIRVAKIESLIEELRSKVAKDATSKDLNWGHAGNLGHYIEVLEDLLGHNG